MITGKIQKLTQRDNVTDIILFNNLSKKELKPFEIKFEQNARKFVEDEERLDYVLA